MAPTGTGQEQGHPHPSKNLLPYVAQLCVPSQTFLSIKPPAEEHFPLSCQPDCSRLSKVVDDSAARSTLSCQWVDVNLQQSKRGSTLRYKPGWTFRTGFSCFGPIYQGSSGIFKKLSEIAQKRKKRIICIYLNNEMRGFSLPHFSISKMARGVLSFTTRSDEWMDSHKHWQ